MFIRLESGAADSRSHVREIDRYTVRHGQLSRGDDYTQITVWPKRRIQLETTEFFVFDRYAESITSKEFADTGAQLAMDLGFGDLVNDCWMRVYIMNDDGKTIDKYEATDRS